MSSKELIQKAICLSQAGKLKEAEDLYMHLLKLMPENEVLLSAIGLFYAGKKDFKNACIYLKKSLDIKETGGILSALGSAEYEVENFSEAACHLEKALEYEENPDVYYKLIMSLYEIKHYKKANELTDRMQELYPDNQFSIIVKIKSLASSGKLIEAEDSCIQYLKDKGDDTVSAGVWCELGFLKELIYRNDIEAIECYKISLKLGNIRALYNIAVSCQKLGKLDEAENLYRKLIIKFPHEINYRVSLGMCLLQQKKFEEGYKYFTERPINNVKKLWKDGDKIEENVTVLCEQGYGDHIQNIRYLPFLKDKNVTVVSSKALINLFSNNYPDINFIELKDYNSDEQTIRITDLAYALDIDFNQIPFAEGYLNAEPANIKSDKIKVGLCWEAGSAAIRTMIYRTIHIKCFEELLKLNNVQFYSFQCDDSFNGNEKYPQMINLAKEFKDFSDTASALKSMDLVISVDTAVAHLAGALGVKTYLLLPYTTDWRWFNDTKTTPWYKSIEIFKQQDPMSWDLPIKEIYSRLEKNVI